MPIQNVQAIMAITASVPVGTGRFASQYAYLHSPPGATQGSVLPIGTAAGQVGDLYANASPISVATASPTTVTLSSLTDPSGTACGFQHVSHVLIENPDTGNSITLAPGASHGVAWLPSGGITLPPATAAQSSCLLLCVPAGLAVASGSADTIAVSASGPNATSVFNLTLLGRAA
jgi:hypothetical protein